MPTKKSVAKKVAAKAIKIEHRAQYLKTVRETISRLQKIADGIKMDLIDDYGLGIHNGFVILEKPQMRIDQAALSEKLGSLDPYKKECWATYIEFPEG